MRDMTQKQFEEALARHGMKESGFMGYVNINVPGHHIEVSKYNAGMNRRAQLAYLLRHQAEKSKECPCGHIKADHCRTAYNIQTHLAVSVGCVKCACDRTKF